MNKNVLYWIIALLVLLNIFTIFMLWQDHWNNQIDLPNRRPGMFRQAKENKPEFIQRELNLSNEQTAKFKDFKKEHIQSINKITDNIHKAKKHLMDEAFLKNSNELKIDSIINKIGNLQKELEEVNITHIKKMKNICRPEQLKKLKIIFNEMMLKTEPTRKNRPGHPKPVIRKSKIK